jgi:hypothetical protein
MPAPNKEKVIRIASILAESVGMKLSEFDGPHEDFGGEFKCYSWSHESENPSISVDVHQHELGAQIEASITYD